MKEEFENIDDLFRQNFANESDIVPDFIKQNIDSALAKKHKKFLFFKIFLSAFIIAGIAIAASYLYNMNESQLKQNLTDNAQQRANENQIKSKNSSDELIAADALNINQSTSENEITSSSFNNKAQEDKKDLETNYSLDQRIENDIAADKKFKNDSHKKNDVDSGNSLKKDVGAQGVKTNDGQSLVITAQSNQEKNDELKYSISLNPRNSIGYLVTNKQDKYLSDLHTKQNAPWVVNNPTIEIHPMVKIQPEEKNYPWMLSLAPTLNIVNSNYQFNLAADDSINNNALNDNLSYGIETSIKYRLANSLTFGTGVGYTSLKESYQLFKQTSSIDSTLTWSYVYDTLDTLQQFPIDSSYQASYDTTLVTLFNETGTNHASFIYIPFSIGTQIKYKKFIFELSAVGRLNILMNATGKYFANNQLSDYDKSGTTYKRYSVNWSFAFNTYYKILPRFMVYGGLRYHPKQSLINNTGFIKTQSGIVFSAGLAYNF